MPLISGKHVQSIQAVRFAGNYNEFILLLRAVHTSVLDRSEVDLSQIRSECERLNGNWDRSKRVWTPLAKELKSISDRCQIDSS